MLYRKTLSFVVRVRPIHQLVSSRIKHSINAPRLSYIGVTGLTPHFKSIDDHVDKRYHAQGLRPTPRVRVDYKI